MKICFICIYIGKLPNYFQLWLNSCKYNTDINWILIIDDLTKYNYPDNIKVIYKNFNEIRNDFQRKFNFTISLDVPYKLCDYRPAFGDIYSEYLVGYDYWGYCDIDCIFGNLIKFIDSDKLREYDKIGFYGHFTIFKNIKEVNKRYKLKLKSKKDYKYVYTNDLSFGFDEKYNDISIGKIYEQYNFKHYDHISNLCADIAPWFHKFKIVDCIKNGYKNKNLFFIYDEGKIIGNEIKNNNIIEFEYGYIHIQKRNFKMSVNETSKLKKYIIIPNEFIHYNERYRDSYNRKFLKKSIVKSFIMGYKYKKKQLSIIYSKIKNMVK